MVAVISSEDNHRVLVKALVLERLKQLSDGVIDHANLTQVVSNQLLAVLFAETVADVHQSFCVAQLKNGRILFEIPIIGFRQTHLLRLHKVGIGRAHAVRLMGAKVGGVVKEWLFPIPPVQKCQGLICGPGSFVFFIFPEFRA